MVKEKTPNLNIYSNGPENKEEQSVYEEIEVNEVLVNTANKTTPHVHDTFDTPTRITHKKQGCSRKATILLLIICIITAIAITIPLVFFITKELELETDVQQIMSEKLEKQLNKTLNKITELETDVQQIMSEKLEKQLNKTLNKITDELKTPTILFRARQLEKDSNLKGKTLVFNNIQFNLGDGYDKTTGIFTTPTDGTYLFTLQLCAEDTYYIEAQIKASTTGEIGRLHTQNNFGRDKPCVSTNAISVLHKGDKVWVMCSDVSSSGDALLVWDGTWFSGVLIHTGVD